MYSVFRTAREGEGPTRNRVMLMPIVPIEGHESLFRREREARETTLSPTQNGPAIVVSNGRNAYPMHWIETADFIQPTRYERFRIQYPRTELSNGTAFPNRRYTTQCRLTLGIVQVHLLIVPIPHDFVVKYRFIHAAKGGVRWETSTTESSTFGKRRPPYLSVQLSTTSSPFTAAINLPSSRDPGMETVGFISQGNSFSVRRMRKIQWCYPFIVSSLSRIHDLRLESTHFFSTINLCPLAQINHSLATVVVDAASMTWRYTG